MEYYYFWFFFFAIVGYFIVTDSSIAKLFDFTVKLIKFQYEKTKWWIFHNPANPIVKYMMWRRAMKMAKELEKEFNKNNG